MPDNAKNKIKFGLQDCMYSLVTETQGQDGKWTSSYGAYKPLPGGVQLSLSPEGEENNFYADNIVYAILNSNQGYSGTAEFAMLPDEAEKDLLNRQVDTNGVISENAENVTPPYFALSFRIEGDVRNRRYVLYRCALNRPDLNAQTKEQNITPNTDSLSFKCTPRPDDGLVFSHTSESTPDAIVNAWNTQVYVPGAQSEEEDPDETDPDNP